ncbi:phosphoribosylanthranilate isomerase [Solimonas aquatica]|uniref:N-(5'-phosphoribosyl)anthranilate isomerase n=1 Tax=Solimonas aquatica TaxID=489703 RepID=A0A1H8ZZW9_9GAMM|nr:phosphoribosylanthranilate isomerase [Solimonas aquatica]SEP69895.1 phosphoribosylanthranilate isomerase [Solimonas aquatica]
MLRTRIKFCGLRRAVDIASAVDCGVDAIGFVLVPASPRFIRAEDAATLRTRLPPFVSAVALFKDQDAASVQDAIDTLRPDLLQFHGGEPAGFCASFGLPYLKSVAMRGKVSLKAEARRHAGAAGLLLDGHAPGEMGGQGETFDWAALPAVNKPLILAGGLTPRNVAKGIALMQPYGVDVSSGIESRPGVKNATAMRDFVAAVRRADARRAKP